MSRFTGPRLKVMRALGVTLPGLSRKSIEKRPTPPGQHGHARKRTASEYALRLKEKQKLRYHYGVNEGQLRRIAAEASRSKTNTAGKLVELLERRLDNVLFRAGFARTIPAARQLVTHGHIVVNGRRLSIPSARLRRGDIVGIAESGKVAVNLQRSVADEGMLKPDWLSVDDNALTATVSGLPEVTTVPFPFEPRLVVEFYA